MQRVPQAAEASRLVIRLTLWAGDSHGRRHMARRDSKVKRGYPGGWATWGAEQSNRGSGKNEAILLQMFWLALETWFFHKSFFTPSKDATAKVSPIPLLSFHLSFLPLASSQGRHGTPGIVAQHVALANPSPPSCSPPPPLYSNHLLRAAVALAWGIRAITAISR